MAYILLHHCLPLAERGHPDREAARHAVAEERTPVGATSGQGA